MRAAFYLAMLPLALRLAMPLAAEAGELIYQCESENGELIFSNMRCDGTQRVIALGEPSIISGSSAQGLTTQAKAIKDLPGDVESIDLRKRQRTNAAATAPTFSQRVALRKLTMRAEGLRRDLRRAVSGGSRLTLKKQLNDVERQIRQQKRLR